MSSILTNNGAMVALQTLKGVNNDLSTTQSQISTGKKVADAKDNAAVWAISKVMESDVQGFKGIKESLSLGESTVAVARSAAETTTDLLTEIKGKIVAAQEENVDRDKIQADVDQLRDQIGSVVNSAQFNGLNLVDGSSVDPVEILSSLDRGADGNVSSGKIEVDAQNLTGDAGLDLAAAALDTNGNLDDSGGGGSTLTFNTTDFIQSDGTVGGTGAISRSDLDAGVDPTDTAAIGTIDDGLMAGDTVSIAVGDNTSGENGTDYLEVSYRVNAGDFAEDVATGLRRELESALAADDGSLDVDGTGTAAGDITATITDGQLEVTNGAGTNVAHDVSVSRGEGSLAGLSGIDVTTSEGASGALSDIEGMIQTAIDASAAFGSAQGRIETQSEFVDSLTDSLKSGIGTLVDADMEETSARLQALQVQQQLATQSLSIANQAPQNLLALFR